MDKRNLQTYSTWAKENLENQIEVSLKALGINNENDIKNAKKVGDVTTIEGNPTSYPADLYGKRGSIISLITRKGYKNVIEEFAYTWFNRFVALKFMEVHGFLPHGFRVLSNPAGGIEPEILKNLNLVKGDLSLDMALCNEYKQQSKIEELFRHVLIKQCNALAGILPMLFSTDMDYLELLLPNNLLKGDTVITRLNEIPESAFMEDVEIIGWMYQFYISSKKDAVYASKKTITKDTLPAVTQLFTPDWIVRYMAQNSVGRLWMESYPDSSLRSEMKYYVEDAEQTQEVQKKIDEIKYKNVNPEDIRIIEPCCGSGHILVYVFDLLYKMYEERGYQKRDIPTLILKNNLVGLDVDKRATQLASFSLIMKARSVNNRFFNDQYYEAPHVYELQDSKLLKDLGYRKQLKDLNLLNDEETSLINYIVETFEDGKTIGSLLKVKPIDFACLDGALDKIAKNVVIDLFNLDFFNMGINRLRELSNLAKILSAKYDVMITNPPYRPISSMEDPVKKYAAHYYPNSKYDMFAMFMETSFIDNNGFLSLVNMHSWMFISSYASLREKILNSADIINMIHLGTHAFDMIAGEKVQTTSFVMRNCCFKGKGVYFRLVDSQNKEADFINMLKNEKGYISDVRECMVIPGAPFSYWIRKRILQIYEEEELLGEMAVARNGMKTGDNNKFLRLWWEVDRSTESMSTHSYTEVEKSDVKWFPYNKGGEYRKWYGNNDYVVNWQYKGLEVIGQAKRDKRNVQDYPLEYKFIPIVTWSLITTKKPSFRYKECCISDIAGMSLYTTETNVKILLGLLNTPVAEKILSYLAPTVNFQAGDIARIPVVKADYGVTEKIIEIVDECIHLSKADWDAFEISWDFEQHPLLPHLSHIESKKLKDLYEEWQTLCIERFSQLKSKEEQLNKIVLESYDLSDELEYSVDDSEISVRVADAKNDIKSLLSYLIGMVMGRYSINYRGIAYAGGDWDASKYVSYQPDDDGIIPIYNTIGMDDGLTTKIIELIKLIYGEDTYRENIDFIAEVLGKNNSESSEETLNRYLNDGFYKDHLKTYQKRPIYWLFSSGKKDGFKCLIYMHRYNEDTLARINAKYFLPESTRKKNELDELNGRIAHTEGRDKLRLERERQNLAAAYNEAIEYGQVLDHMANQYIAIDLDDGVKENYAKFQNIEIVTDGGSKVKKDLLAPLK